MFKLLGQRHKTKEREEGAAEALPAGKDVLDEEQVVDLVSELSEEHGVSPSASVRSILKAAIRSADQIVESIKMRARAEAEEEAARIIAQAKKEAEEIRRGLATTVEKEAEDILSAAEEVAEKEEGVLTQLEKAAAEPVAEEKDFTEAAPEAGRDRQEEAELSALKRGKGSLYAGEVELALGVPMDPNLVAKLYNYLQMTPEIKFVRTSGSWNRGATITVTLDKPIPLVSVLSSKLPEAEVTPAPPEKGDLAKKGKGIRRINIALKES
ncbi:MAG TPA: hypothetical protein G4O01_03190 [Dehalococcoidia bacterium]|nr:hypothetical protein [Dehalococcoidia bacterium]